MNLAQNFECKITGAENLLVRQHGRYLFYSSTIVELSEFETQKSVKTHYPDQSFVNYIQNFTPIQS